MPPSCFVENHSPENASHSTLCAESPRSECWVTSIPGLDWRDAKASGIDIQKRHTGPRCWILQLPKICHVPTSCSTRRVHVNLQCRFEFSSLRKFGEEKSLTRICACTSRRACMGVLKDWWSRAAILSVADTKMVRGERTCRTTCRTTTTGFHTTKSVER